jgi:periplasmic protein TonB
MNFTRVVPTQSRWLAGFTPVRLGWRRAREVPATGIPGPRDRKRNGTIVSVLVHALILLLFVLQASQPHTDPNLKPLSLGAGGPGPVGGGGGGNQGTGGVRFIQIAPPPKPITPPVTPLPVVEPPKPPEPVLPQIEMPKLAEQKVAVQIQSPIVGIGGGTGNDGTKGNGPGTGGGIGSGIGTGNGSGLGPGTGGGNTLIHPPTMTELFIPPLPLPKSVKGSEVLAEFDVDSTGRVISYHFTPTKDRGYDKKLDEVLKGFRFRPGTTMQGVPVRAKAQITLSLGG